MFELWNNVNSQKLKSRQSPKREYLCTLSDEFDVEANVWSILRSCLNITFMLSNVLLISGLLYPQSDLATHKMVGVLKKLCRNNTVPSNETYHFV